MFFSVLAGIIPLSLRNGGHLIPFAPLSASGGNCPLCSPGSAAYDLYRPDVLLVTQPTVSRH